MSKFICFVVLMFIASRTCAQRQDARLKGLDLIVRQLMEKFECVGLAIAIVEKDQTIYSKGYGYRDLENKKRVTSNTLFGIGSITKQFTAGLMGIYEDRGILSVHDRPAKFIKDLKFSTDEMNTIVTIEDLMAHRSGLGNLDGAMVFFPRKDLFQNIERLPYLAPSSQVRERMDYSNMGYAILGAISESIGHDTWSENIHREIFRPLGMNQSNTTIEALQKCTNFSLAYSVHDNKPTQVVFDPLDETSPGGSINSSANEMTYWVRMLLAGGYFKEQQIISKTYLERAFSGQNFVSDRFSFEKKDSLLFDTYGYGLAINNYFDHYRVHHSGAVSGFTASLELYPFESLGIVVLTNQHLSALSGHLVDIIARRMLKLPRKDWGTYEVQRTEARMYNDPINPINKDYPPTLSLSSYGGVYTHKGYGQMEITLQNGNLFVNLPAFKLGLEHDQGDVFYNKSITQIHQNCPSFNFTFLVDQGKVTGVSIPFQATPVMFVKE